MTRTIGILSRVIQKIEEVLLATAILLIAVLTVANVICRFLFASPLAFSEEVSQYCIIVVTFVGLSYAASQGRHIRMTAIYDLQSKLWRRRSMIVINGLTSALLLVLTWYACLYVHTVYQLGGIYPVLRVPFYVVYSVAPLGLLLGGIQYALTTWKNVISEEPYVSFELRDEQEQPIQQEI